MLKIFEIGQLVLDLAACFRPCVVLVNRIGTEYDY